MEAIILKISWHCQTMKMRNNSKAKHVEKIIIIKIIIIIIIIIMGR